jgi:hypothetical protein
MAEAGDGMEAHTRKATARLREQRQRQRRQREEKQGEWGQPRLESLYL